MLWLLYSLKNTVFRLFLAVFQHLKKIEGLNQKSAWAILCPDIVSTPQYKFYDVNLSRECCGFCTVVAMGVIPTILYIRLEIAHIWINNTYLLTQIRKNNLARARVRLLQQIRKNNLRA